MADLANKYPQNVTGRYFVDDQCIDCDRPDPLKSPEVKNLLRAFPLDEKK